MDLKTLPVGMFFALAVTLVHPDPGDRMPSPPYPSEALAANQAGTVIVKVSFAKDGDVSDCHVVKSSTSRGLAKATCLFIRENWHCSISTERIVVVPIVYNIHHRSSLPGATIPRTTMASTSGLSTTGVNAQHPYSDSWGRDFPPPFVNGGPDLTLAVTFDQQGNARKCTVADSSGYPKWDAYAVEWAQAHWHHTAYAGLTTEMRIGFNFIEPVWRAK